VSQPAPSGQQSAAALTCQTSGPLGRRRYRTAKTPHVGSFESVMAWLDRNEPVDARSCLIHNDFRFDNIVFGRVHPHTPVGLLDWQMATVGRPLMDLAGALAYWIQADDAASLHQFRRQPTHAAGMLTQAEVVEYYCRRVGIGLTDREWRFHEVFGMFRKAAICQQIYHRYYHGQTTNPAFRLLGVLSVLLEGRCRGLIAHYR
jgi:aminoglycoside phosphotransferase (APT) family kinase protein